MDVYDSVKGNTHTNLGASELSYLVSCFASGEGANTQFTSVTGTTKMLTDADGLVREHVFLDDDSVMKAMMKVFYIQVD